MQFEMLISASLVLNPDKDGLQLAIEAKCIQNTRDADESDNNVSGSAAQHLSFLFFLFLAPESLYS